MRVTAEAKESTRRGILEAARELFRTTGFEATTTRDIARAAGIATGTLFNYFPTKEAIVTSLVMDAQARSARGSGPRGETLRESLFAQVVAGMRLLKPYRKFLPAVFDTALSPLTAGRGDDAGGSLRTDHLESVVDLARQHGLAADLTPVALQMYWTLYLGVLTFWASDKSPKQEDTLALLDQSLEMFTRWLGSDEEKPN